MTPSLTELAHRCGATVSARNIGGFHAEQYTTTYCMTKDDLADFARAVLDSSHLTVPGEPHIQQPVEVRMLTEGEIYEALVPSWDEFRRGMFDSFRSVQMAFARVNGLKVKP